MPGTWIIAWLSLGAPATQGQAELVPAALVPMVVISPRGTSLRVSTADWLTAADRVFARHARVRILSSEQAGIDAESLLRCDADRRFSCWAEAALENGRRSDGRPFRWLLVVATYSIAGRKDRTSLAFLDLDAARIHVREVDRSHADWPEMLETRVFANTVALPPEDVMSTDPAALQTYFADKLSGPLKDQLASAGIWGAFGTIEVHGLSASARVRIDDRDLGSGFKRWEVQGVPPGVHRVVIQKGTTEVERTVTVQGGRRVEVGLPPVAPPPHPGYTATWIAGSALAATGLALVVVGAVQANDGTQVTCLQRGNQSCASLGTPTFSDRVDNLPSLNPDEVSGAVGMAPLGIALTLAGVTWGLGPQWEGTEDMPWWSLGLGLVAGGLGYGISAAVLNR